MLAGVRPSGGGCVLWSKPEIKHAHICVCVCGRGGCECAWPYPMVEAGPVIAFVFIQTRGKGVRVATEHADHEIH